jgi:hypothetical protein
VTGAKRLVRPAKVVEMADLRRFVLHKLSFTGPNVETKALAFNDGLNLIWGASNAGKSFIVKALDFMTGAGSPLPNITERKGYDRCWLELDLPETGRVTLARALSGRGFALYLGMVEPGTTASPDRTLAAAHTVKSEKSESLSGFLLNELGIVDKKVARVLDGSTSPFTFRFFAPYVFTEETAMMGETSPIKIDSHTTETLDKNVLKFILTGVDDSGVVASLPVRQQRALNSGKLQIVEEMTTAALAELSGLFPNDDVATLDLETQESEISTTVVGLAETLGARQSELDMMRRDRRARLDEREEVLARASEIAITIDRFLLLAKIYDSDVERLLSLEEGAAALLAGAKRPCPLCGADPEHQHEVHGLDQVARSQRAVRAEIAKIKAERLDLAKAVASLQAEAKGLDLREERLTAEIIQIEERIADVRPLEATSRKAYEDLDQARQRVREGLALRSRIEGLEKRKASLQRFRPTSVPRDQVTVGVGNVVGHEFAQEVQSILTAWHFPGAPIVAFDEKNHDILIDGKDRESNGKGVRALMNAAFKLGVLAYCRRKALPHPGIVALDSPLLTYRDPHNSKYGELSVDEQAVKESGVKDWFYRYLIDHADGAQFIVIENDPAPINLGLVDGITVFTGPQGHGGRQGLF